MVATMVDVEAAFVHGEFEGKHKMCVKVPQGFEKWYGTGVYLFLL